ncbi:MAG: hypothetical protein P8Y99_13890 [Calditrichaceae bacterium]
MFKSIFKLIVLIVLFAACSEINRDNLLDPKNPDSYSETPILIEAFVNTAFEYDLYALEALNKLEDQFGDEINFEIIEYHRPHPLDSTSSDPYTVQKFSDLHTEYVNNYDEIKAVPDIFFNGGQGMFRGAYDNVDYIYSKLTAILSDLAGQQSEYSIEVNLETSGNLLDIKYRLARLGDTEDSDLELYYCLIKDYDTPYTRKVVDLSNYPDVENINRIKKGEYVEGSIENLPCPNKPKYAIFSIKKKDDITILKTLKKEIPW